jgi:glycosyltransferase involved in cell wall biosynthesis
VIPNPLDTSFFPPIVKSNSVIPTVLFFGGESDNRKGWGLLRESCIQAKVPYKFVLTGSELNEKIGVVQVIGIPRIESVALLTKTLSDANLVVVVSRAEALPQAATETISCGIPVVAFSIGGMPDIIFENIIGKLVTPFDTGELSKSIDDMLTSGKLIYQNNCRQFCTRKL